MWKGKWKQGEITLETDSLDELNSTLNALMPLKETEEATSESKSNNSNPESCMSLEKGLGCTETIRQLLFSDWGSQPRSMKEIDDELKTRALYFSQGSLSGTLNFLTKSGKVRRLMKDGKWTYIMK